MHKGHPCPIELCEGVEVAVGLKVQHQPIVSTEGVGVCHSATGVVGLDVLWPIGDGL